MIDSEKLFFKIFKSSYSARLQKSNDDRNAKYQPMIIKIDNNSHNPLVKYFPCSSTRIEPNIVPVPGRDKFKLNTRRAI